MLLFALSLSRVDALANVSCQFDYNFNPPRCIAGTITPVTSANEEIVVNGQLTTYTDPSVNTLSFNDTATLNYIPTNIFKIFPNVMHFSAVNQCKRF